MPMYAISIIPVIQQLMSLARQVWYADDAAAEGGLLHLRGIGGLGCCRLAVILVIMLMPLRLGWLLSGDTWLRLSAWYWHPDYVCWWPYLGAPLGSRDFIVDYMQDHVSHDQWLQGLSHLSSFAAMQPMLGLPM